MIDPDTWERVGRETLHCALVSLLEDADATVEPVADAVYWDHDVSAEQVEAMRQLVYDFEYATEAYLARLCEDAEPWDDEKERTPSRLPAVGGEGDDVEGGEGNEAEGREGDNAERRVGDEGKGREENEVEGGKGDETEAREENEAEN
jgi:hypothetical protein